MFNHHHEFDDEFILTILPDYIVSISHQEFVNTREKGDSTAAFEREARFLDLKHLQLYCEFGMAKYLEELHHPRYTI